MTQKKVEVIPATKRSVHNGGQLKVQSNIRVAAYCRVSTGDESQQTSYTTQKAFYTNLITNKPGWRFAGIYADEAKSGTSREHREDFNRMMADALDGKLDYIVTKSISRFARNTVDTLNCVRQLRQQNPPVGVYFEKENIDTLDATGELILTILSALAQDESRSISDNIRWSIQKNFQAGKPKIDLNRMLGYDKGENGEWVINPEQAKTASSVLTVLRNEKYVGDIEMQKTITKDFLTHRSTINKGEAPRYYVENHHVGIIDRSTWDKAQTMLYEKPSKVGDSVPAQKKKRGYTGSPFGNLVCGAVLEHGERAGKECGEGDSSVLPIQVWQPGTRMTEALQQLVAIRISTLKNTHMLIPYGGVNRRWESVRAKSPDRMAHRTRSCTAGKNTGDCRMPREKQPMKDALRKASMNVPWNRVLWKCCTA